MGKLHCLKIDRVLKSPGEKTFYKKSMYVILTDVEAKELHKKLDKKFGKRDEEITEITLPKETVKKTSIFGLV